MPSCSSQGTTKSKTVELRGTVDFGGGNPQGSQGVVFPSTPASGNLRDLVWPSPQVTLTRPHALFWERNVSRQHPHLPRDSLLSKTPSVLGLGLFSHFHIPLGRFIFPSDMPLDETLSTITPSPC